MTEAVTKKKIPHVSEAGDDHAKHRAAVAHLDEQVAAGHYSIEFSQHQMGPGHERIIVDRRETDTSVAAEPHGLFDAE